jgi:hypothetical protein
VGAFTKFHLYFSIQKEDYVRTRRHIAQACSSHGSNNAINVHIPVSEMIFLRQIMCSGKCNDIV